MPIKRDDPLIGKIVSSIDQKEMGYQELVNELLQADIIYLGENHDNADQHQHQD